MKLNNKTISKIKKETNSKGKVFYKVFFKEILFNENEEKVFFAWPTDHHGNNIQAFEMINEKQYKEGDIVNIEYYENNGYNNLLLLSKYVNDNVIIQKNNNN